MLLINSTLSHIIVFGILMSVISFIGAFTIVMNKKRLDRYMSLFIAMAAGTLFGGACFHMIPHAVTQGLSITVSMLILVLGFVTMYALELFFHWHHCAGSHHSESKVKKPEGLLILLSDSIHNLIGGLGIGAAFIADIKLGISMWFVAVLHEIPQEIGDYAILLNSGWRRRSALLYNFFASLTFLFGMVLIYFLDSAIEVSYLIPFTAGNFIYIAASDLIPEVKQHPKLKNAIMHLAFLIIGLMLLWLPEIVHQ